MTTLVTGAAGQLGRTFGKKITQDVVFANRNSCDLSNPKALKKQLDKINPKTIINCAAYTAVDEAESNPEIAFRINADAVGEMSDWCAKAGATFVHFSTDYVFDGHKLHHYTEEDTPNPLSVYGKSKRCGEEKFLESGCRGLCLRTSWLHSAHGKNFFLTMMRLLNTKRDIQVVNDQIGVPTTTTFLAELTLELLNGQNGEQLDGTILHACPSGHATWYDFAVYIQQWMRRTGIPIICQKITPISSNQFMQKAPRPRLSALSNSLVTSKLPAFDLQWQMATDNISLEDNLWNR